MFDRQQSIREARAVVLTSTDDTMPANKPTRTVYVGTGGVLNVELVGNPGVTVSYTVVTGTRHQLQVSKFIRSATTASNIIAEF